MSPTQNLSGAIASGSETQEPLTAGEGANPVEGLSGQEDTVNAYLLGAAVEAERHEDTAYELSAEQVAEIRRRLLDGVWECLWCNVKLRGRGGAPTGHPHKPDCLLADITEAAK